MAEETTREQITEAGTNRQAKATARRIEELREGNTITSQDLAGGTPTKHNIVDPGPVLEVDGQGNPTSDQYLNPGETFTIPGNFKVLAIDPPSDGVLVQIGNRKTWVTQSVLEKA